MNSTILDRIFRSFNYLVSNHQEALELGVKTPLLDIEPEILFRVSVISGRVLGEIEVESDILFFYWNPDFPEQISSGNYGRGESYRLSDRLAEILLDEIKTGAYRLFLALKAKRAEQTLEQEFAKELGDQPTFKIVINDVDFASSGTDLDMHTSRENVEGGQSAPTQGDAWDLAGVSKKRPT